MQRDVQLSTEQQEDKKQPYEKPTVGAVRLFADQVLQSCPNNLADESCIGNDPSFS